MTRVLYLDASAIVKLVVREEASDVLRGYLGSAELVTSAVASVEVPRAAFLKTGNARVVRHAERILGRFALVVLDEDLQRKAARAQPPGLRTLDAIHLVSALELRDRVESAVIYDHRLAEAARAAGLSVHAPG
ncbi:MAG: type II toxin-antitoxin system VapC family toxin [Candidatus Dormibacteria bacterium]